MTMTLLQLSLEGSSFVLPFVGNPSLSGVNNNISSRQSRDNFLVLDIFFEALNYETIEQKKAYDVAGLLGMLVRLRCHPCPYFPSTKKKK